MAMNLLRIYGATLLVALTMGMSACKNEDAPVTAPATNAEANSGQKISLNVDIEGFPAVIFVQWSSRRISSATSMLV